MDRMDGMDGMDQEEAKEKKYETTALHFDCFKGCVSKWIEYFGLYEWRIYYEHKDISDKTFCRAWTDFEGMTATLQLNSVFSVEPKRAFLDLVAFHEVCELLLSHLSALARTRFGVLGGDIEESKHRVIRILENAVWKRRASAVDITPAESDPSAAIAKEAHTLFTNNASISERIEQAAQVLDEHDMYEEADKLRGVLANF